VHNEELNGLSKALLPIGIIVGI